MEINRNNYESFFLLYLDRELSPAAMGEVDRFLAENADLKKEFVLLQQTIVFPEHIVFEPKELLLRREEHKRAVPMYWMRFAAAVAVLIMAGWMFLNSSKNSDPEAGGKTDIAKTNSAKQKIPVQVEDKNSGQPTNKKLQDPAVIKNSTEKLGHENLSPKNSVVKSGVPVKSTVSHQMISTKTSSVEKQNPDLPGDSEEPELTMQKSNTTLDLQSGSVTQERNSVPIAAVPGLQSSSLVLTANKTNDLIAYEHAVSNEPDFKTDNAISVVTLNDNNKAITGFFKKLTKRASTDVTTKNTRKLRVSVFQISY